MGSKFQFQHIFLSEHDRLLFLGSNQSHHSDWGRYTEFVDVWACYQLISHVISLEPLPFHIFHIKREKWEIRRTKRTEKRKVEVITSKNNPQEMISKIPMLHSDWLNFFSSGYYQIRGLRFLNHQISNLNRSSANLFTGGRWCKIFDAAFWLAETFFTTILVKNTI